MIISLYVNLVYIIDTYRLTSFLTQLKYAETILSSNDHSLEKWGEYWWNPLKCNHNWLYIEYIWEFSAKWCVFEHINGYIFPLSELRCQNLVCEGWYLGDATFGYLVMEVGVPIYHFGHLSLKRVGLAQMNGWLTK